MMKIVALAAAFPSRDVDNQMVVDMIKARSPDFGQADPKTFEKLLLRALKGSGSNIRKWRNDDETSLQLVSRACHQALREAGSKPDLIIYASVYGELVEPSSASLIASMIGLPEVECMDMKLACDGFMKAAKTAQAFIMSGQYVRVMIINSEFVMKEGFGLYPELFTNITSADDLTSRFPAYTLGEVATAVILEKDETSAWWKFTNTTRNDLYDVCSIPSPHNHPGSIPSKKVGANGPGVFVSYGAELKHHGFPLAVAEFRKASVPTSDIDLLFTHSSSYRDWHEVAVDVGLSEKLVDIYRTHGNVVSAAVPAAMAVAKEEGRLVRGSKVFCLVASAGMSFSSAYFVF